MLLPMEMQPNVVKSAKNPESNQEELKLKKPDWCIQIISVCNTMIQRSHFCQKTSLEKNMKMQRKRKKIQFSWFANLTF